MPNEAAIKTKNPLVFVGGQELPPAELKFLAEIRVEMELRLPGRVTLRFQDPDGSIATGSTFKLGSTVQIKPPGGEPLIDAEITGLAYEASTGADPKQRFGGRTGAVDEFIVTAHDRAHRLTRQTTVAGLADLTSSQIVQRVAQASGLQPQVDATSATYHSVMQLHNDFELLNALADREGYDWWVGPGNKLFFKPPQTSGSVTLELGTEQLESFSVSATGMRPDKVSVRGWDRDQQQAVVGEATLSSSTVWPSDVALLTDFKDAGSKFDGDKAIITGQFTPTPDDKTTVAEGLARRIAAGSIMARGVGEGNASITIGASVHVKGSKPVQGVYHVTKVEHLVRPESYKTRFVAGDRTPTSLADLGSRPDQSQYPLRHFGVVTAVVSGLAAANANNDQNMLRVTFPGLDAQLVSPWARFLAIGAGGANGRGLVMLPEVGDEVLVAFENGDLHQPVVLGGLYSAKNNTIGTWDVEGGKAMSRRFISRQGHLLEIKDGDKDADRYLKIEVQREATNTTASLLIAGDKVELTTPAEEPVTIKSGESTISIAKNGDVSIEAPNITLKGKAKVSIQAPTIEVKADSQLDLESSGGKTTLKGMTVEASSPGPMTIKGMPVKVN